MKNISIYSILILLVIISSCAHDHSHDHEGQGHDAGHSSHAEPSEVKLSAYSQKSLGLQVGPIEKRKLSSFVQTNGHIKVPPQNEASITAIFGSNVKLIKVIEGDKVNKGQVIAYIEHPNLINAQTRYLQLWNELSYLEKEYERKQMLFKNEVGSGKDLEKAKSEYLSVKGQLAGTAAELDMLGSSVDALKAGKVLSKVPVKSPISGFITKVNVKTGQYIAPTTAMFEVVNIDHVHADFMVYENDLSKIKEGQIVELNVQSNPDKRYQAKIYAVGKAFEENPKAVHLHAEIQNKSDDLLPGMYIAGKIYLEENQVLAVPEEAVVREGDKNYIFIVKNRTDSIITFRSVEVIVSIKNDGWVQVNPVLEINEGQIIAMNNAFFLMAEMKKEQAEHSH